MERERTEQAIERILVDREAQGLPQRLEDEVAAARVAALLDPMRRG